MSNKKDFLEKYKRFSPPLPTERLESTTYAFRLFDKDGDGRVSFEDLVFGLKRMAKDLLCKEFEILLKNFDSDNDGFVTLEEFIKLSGVAFFAGQVEEELRLVFNIFDKDSNGFITAKELQDFNFSIGSYYSIEECRKMIKAVDLNGDGKVDFKEFHNLMLGVKT